MLQAMNRKFVEVVEPNAILDEASATANVIDTKGYDYVVVNVYLGATDIALTALKLQEAAVAASATALTDGADGLTAYRAIAAKAGDHLNPGGHVLVEIGPTQAGAVGAFFADAGAETQVIHDLDGRDRVILARFSA